MQAHEYRRTIIPTQGNTHLLNRLWGCEVGKAKRVIKQKLIENQDIRDLIDNPELANTDDYSEYLYTNIFPFLVIPSTISEKQNYICFKVDDADSHYYNNQRMNNDIMKVVNIQFMVLVHKDNAKTEYGVERHDAIAYIIKKIFNWSQNLFDFRMRCVSDIEGVTDNDYLTRTLTFEVEQTSDLNDTRRVNAYNN